MEFSVCASMVSNEKKLRFYRVVLNLKRARAARAVKSVTLRSQSIAAALLELVKL